MLRRYCQSMFVSRDGCPLRAAAGRLALLLGVILMMSSGLRAQNYSWDARSVGMGGETGLGGGNLTADMVPADRNYTSIVVPLGLIQVLSHLEVFDPNDPGFDALRAIDYVGNPFHYSFGRDEKTGNVDFVKNIIDSGFNRNLNTYRGFSPPEHMVAGGVFAPSWGHTFKVHKGANNSYQGIYVGAGPHLALQAEVQFDPRLIAILGSPVNVTVPANTTFFANNTASQQTAAAVTGGYRAKFGLGGNSLRDGLYFAVNVSYLIGIHRDVTDMSLKLATDSTGLLTVAPLQVPLGIDYFYSRSGRGVSTDVGIEIVKSGFEIGAGANNVGNYINWTNNHAQRFSLTSLTTGVSFVKTGLAAPTGAIRQEIPIEYVSNLRYSRGRWTVRTDEIYGLQKFAAHVGGELRLGPVALRGGSRYGLKRWNPTGGLGLNFSRRFGIDVGFFGNTTNLEQRRNIAMAVSLRIEHPVKD
jgi:hypothetical protein